MEEALIEDITEYPSLLKLFTRKLKESARTVSTEYSLVSPYLYGALLPVMMKIYLYPSR